MWADLPYSLLFQHIYAFPQKIILKIAKLPSKQGDYHTPLAVFVHLFLEKQDFTEFETERRGAGHCILHRHTSSTPTLHTDSHNAIVLIVHPLLSVTYNKCVLWTAGKTKWVNAVSNVWLRCLCMYVLNTWCDHCCVTKTR